MKIALVAMSGVRVCDPELLRLGLTLPGFVERARTIASLPSLGLLTLAGQTSPEHEVSYLEVDDLRAAGTLPLDADLVAISTFSAQATEAYDLAGRFVERGIPVVLGGLHATALPDEVVAAGATAAVGEGERVAVRPEGHGARFHDLPGAGFTWNRDLGVEVHLLAPGAGGGGEGQGLGEGLGGRAVVVEGRGEVSRGPGDPYLHGE